jgi:leader peptidase (prepilin peptidase)/N-methyltransferase
MNHTLLLLAFVFGTIFGSFGNVLILRLPIGKTMGGRSACPHCNHTLHFIDLVPIVGFLLRRGKCAYCRAPISWQYPLVELISGLLWVLAAHIAHFAIIPSILLAFCFWLLLIISVIDWKIQGIPDVLSFPFIVFSIAFGLWTQTIDPISIAIGAAFLSTQWLLSGGTWIGAGDIILIIGIGALIGQWPLMIVCMFAAYIIGAIIAVILLATKVKSRRDALAFGPFLAIGTIGTMWVGSTFLRVVYHIHLQ